MFQICPDNFQAGREGARAPCPPFSYAYGASIIIVIFSAIKIYRENYDIFCSVIVRSIQ